VSATERWRLQYSEHVIAAVLLSLRVSVQCVAVLDSQSQPLYAVYCIAQPCTTQGNIAVMRSVHTAITKQAPIG
jgi:hypothetical protein